MTIKEKIKDLWKLCFDDSEEFIDLYFKLRYTNKANVSLQSGSEIISALQMIAYPMTFCGAMIQTSYISGACTHPDYRGRGVMTELLSQSFTRMIRNNIILSTLIPAEPWLFNYYERMGYSPVFQYSESVIDTGNINTGICPDIIQATGFDPGMYDYLNRSMVGRTCCLQHTVDDYKIILEDMAMSGGKLFAAYDKKNITGMAFVVPDNNFLRVTDIFANNDDIRNALLQQAGETYNQKKITIVQPPVDNPVNLGMARIIHARPVLQLYAAANPEKEINIDLYDAELSLNNGYYYLNGGKCMTTKKRIPGSHLQLTIGELTGILLTPLKPYMSLMLN